MCDPKQATPGEPTWCNGGIPQRVDLDAHAAKVTRSVIDAIPDPNFAGLAVIDFETWQPTWSWSGCDGTPAAVPVCAASLQRVKRANPTWNASAVAIEAERQWGEAAMSFMTRTIEAGRSARPNAKWSFYDYPSCGDAAGEYGGADTSCPSGMQEGNEKLAWMYNITVSACSGNACILPRYSIIVRSCRFAVRAC
jgi:hyaluronoglucosaminidase